MLFNQSKTDLPPEQHIITFPPTKCYACGKIEPQKNDLKLCDSCCRAVRLAVNAYKKNQIEPLSELEATYLELDIEEYMKLHYEFEPLI